MALDQPLPSLQAGDWLIVEDGAVYIGVYVLEPTCLSREAPILLERGPLGEVWPLIYLRRQQSWTLTLGLSALADPNFVDYGPRMAGAVLISILPIMVFFLSQRYFIRGVTTTGLKG